MRKIITLMIITSTILSFSCKKKNVEEEPSFSDNISGVRIRYVLSVVGAENSISKSARDIKNALVTIVADDSIRTKSVDSNGMVYFDNLFAGNTIVRVECEGYSTANLRVDLTIPDSLNVYDSNSHRVVSTIVTLLPVQGDNMATVSGDLYAELDLTNSSMEPVLQNLLIRATVDPDQFDQFVEHTASGAILDFSYENISFTTNSSNGKYLLKVPSSLKGLKISLNSDNFSAQQQITLTDSERRIYLLETDHAVVYPGSRIIKDLIYTY